MLCADIIYETKMDISLEKAVADLSKFIHDWEPTPFTLEELVELTRARLETGEVEDKKAASSHSRKVSVTLSLSQLDDGGYETEELGECESQNEGDGAGKAVEHGSSGWPDDGPAESKEHTPPISKDSREKWRHKTAAAARRSTRQRYHLGNEAAAADPLKPTVKAKEGGVARMRLGARKLKAPGLQPVLQGRRRLGDSSDDSVRVKREAATTKCSTAKALHSDTV